MDETKAFDLLLMLMGGTLVLSVLVGYTLKGKLSPKVNNWMFRVAGLLLCLNILAVIVTWATTEAPFFLWLAVGWIMAMAAGAMLTSGRLARRKEL